MKDYRTVETSAEVWAVIRARHPELVLFSTASFEGFPVFPITLAAATLGVMLCLIYTVLWDFFDRPW